MWPKVDMNVFGFSRGLEDLKVSCASIHSDHSSGLSKSVQNYRYLDVLDFVMHYC